MATALTIDALFARWLRKIRPLLSGPEESAAQQGEPTADNSLGLLLRTDQSLKVATIVEASPP
jgi:hypothetical protein